MVRNATGLWAIGTLAAALLLPGTAAATPLRYERVADHPDLIGGTAITRGADGALWFAGRDKKTPASHAGEGPPLGSPAISRLTPDGRVTHFTAGLKPDGSSHVAALTPGPDGNVWFVDDHEPSAIGRITPAGEISEFEDPSGRTPVDLVTGPDGNVWIAYHDAIGRLTPDLKLKLFEDGLGPADELNADYRDIRSITAGSDGALWFTDTPHKFASPPPSPPSIGRITTDGAITLFPIPDAAQASDLTAGPDGNVWAAAILKRAVHYPHQGFALPFTQVAIRVTPQGAMSTFSAGVPALSGIDGPEAGTITVGPDRNLWLLGGSSLTLYAPTGAVVDKVTHGLDNDYTLYGLNAIAADASGAWVTADDALIRVQPGRQPALKIACARHAGRRTLRCSGRVVSAPAARVQPARDARLSSITTRTTASAPSAYRLTRRSLTGTFVLEKGSFRSGRYRLDEGILRDGQSDIDATFILNVAIR
jgi:hypothetical protein